MRTKEVTYKIMSAIKSKNTRPEKLFEKALKKSKIKYRKHYLIEGKPDFVILSKKVAIFIDGDFWHGNNWRLRGYKNRAQELKSYKKFWSDKIKNNVARDKKINRILRKKGWVVLRFWESRVKKNCSALISKINL
jgi:DNA mismatch endonuclease (patch repair protein)